MGVVGGEGRGEATVGSKTITAFNLRVVVLSVCVQPLAWTSFTVVDTVKLMIISSAATTLSVRSNKVKVQVQLWRPLDDVSQFDG